MSSWRIGTIAGIDIRLHFTFPLVFLWAAYEFGGTTNPRMAAFGVLLMTLFFVCVLLHELGHAFAARLFRIPVEQIILLPIGGLAMLRIARDDALEEFMIAVAGPLVNFLIVLFLLPLFYLSSSIFDTAVVNHVSEQMGSSRAMAVLWLMEQQLGTASLDATFIMLIFGNLVLALFNLLPVFPMDGGRAFRALLAFLLPYQTASVIAIRIGQLLALLLLFYGIRNSLSLVLIALFVLWSSSGELRRLSLRRVLEALQVRDYMTPPYAVPPTWSIEAARQLHPILMPLAVVDQGRLVGLLPLTGRLSGGQRVSEQMVAHFATLSPAETIYEAQMALFSNDQPVAAVIENGRVVGLIAQDTIDRAFRAAQQRKGR
ncbi:MAG: hypothetical protein KDD73_14490 [Anaerolineales bacterium]|nr:hypothetical protein [Anaerolineales bacterium]MCB9126975.1 hypothetical protein [Ardenticatenales bacterium]MCB9171528.1 hypothetical protein [Ardenticatenales bacterium]